ncbi:13643_t:CDS:2, partial [Ambispora gerdemannii]
SDYNWKHFEQSIMSFYTKCVYAASSRANNSQVLTPDDEELTWMHTEGLICHLRGNHNKCWPEVCWIVENPDLSLSTPNLISADENQCKRLLEFLKKIMKPKEHQSLITTIRTSYNEAFNRLKLNYTEKKIDYPKSFRARHALSIIHNNNGFVELQHSVREAGNLISFSNQDEKNLLEGFDYSQDLVPYGLRTQEELLNSKFEPSFAPLITAFKSLSLKCVACQSFQKKFTNGLCALCGYLSKHNLFNHIPNIQYQQLISESNWELNIDSIITEFFGFEEYREKQRESILSFLSDHDTLTILKTGGGKSLIYATVSILSRRLTIVFTPQKALMDDQVREMVGMGIPAAMLYASSEQPLLVQEKIFAEIASGLIRLQFVIDEAHCVVLYEGFR